MTFSQFRRWDQPLTSQNRVEWPIMAQKFSLSMRIYLNSCRKIAQKKVSFNHIAYALLSGKQVVKTLYKGILSRWSEHAKSKKYEKVGMLISSYLKFQSFLLLLVKLLCLHGVPFDCHWEFFGRLGKLVEMHTLYKTTPSQNIGLL